MARGGRGGDGDDGAPAGGRPGRPPGGPESVAAAQQAVSTEAQQGRPGGGAGRTRSSDEPATPASAQSFVDNITADPRSVSGRSAQDIADQFTAAGYPATVEQSRKKGTSGNAVQVRIQNHPEITNIQVHPGGGRHTPEGSPYWKISTNTAGKTWVIPRDFRGAEELGGNVVRYDE
ncbi:hypothetical protein DMB66_30940 [Actinoplanes sp. ATCC 53533]|uniref:hypothetical protein n=1 Tax=Actinoplanes sp. ATCC 53533 TaxID=1288362 RepID=UPI000F77F1FA|nr:hypothetical protein [Actinoplanes sp. ATCC 53533]RSM58108.1 hypothetical protein DMB66_30940 [Actinoplanes sp. ATCC 53533]